LGAFGEIGQIPNAPDFTPDERKVFRAVGKAHVLANLPVFTHNAYGTGPNVPREAGLRQLDVFESVGVDPRRVAIGHVCCLDDPSADIMKQIAKRGAFVGFDRMEDVHPRRPGAENVVVDVPDAQRVRMILAFLDAGYVDHLLLSADCTGQPIKFDEEVNQMVADGWLASGDGKKIKAILEDSMGYMRTLSGFVPKLRAAGVNEATLRTILQDNPRRFLAFVPKESA
jgi:phosphotriesterase-related protein